MDFVDLSGLMLEVVDSLRYLCSTVTTNNEAPENMKMKTSADLKSSWVMKSILNTRLVS